MHMFNMFEQLAASLHLGILLVIAEKDLLLYGQSLLLSVTFFDWSYFSQKEKIIYEDTTVRKLVNKKVNGLLDN